ncbi:MAG: hypothetical protein ABR563_10425 [Pyrinomonadaceae bacterium]
MTVGHANHDPAKGCRAKGARRYLAVLLFASSLAFAVFACASFARAQELVLPPQPAPPPMKYVPEVERGRLAGARDAKERVRETLEMLEERLASTERYTAASRFDPATADLGVYEALLDDLLAYLKPLGRSADGTKVDGRTRDLYKLIEQTLNKHTARIESVRRLTPQEYQPLVRAAFNHTRDKREEALDAFFASTVLRNARPTGEPPPDANKPPPADEGNGSPKTDSKKPPARKEEL